MLGYDIAGPFGQLFLTDSNHWTHSLPGGLFQNTISHPLYRITDFVTDVTPTVMARWSSNGASRYPTELSAIIVGANVSAHLLFTTRSRARARVARVYGSRRWADIDLDAQTLYLQSAPRLPGPFGKLEAPWLTLRQSARAFRRNLWRFMRSDLHYFSGMGTLFRRFYSAIRSGGPPPIPYDEIVRITNIMDRLFMVCRANVSPVDRNGCELHTDRNVASPAVRI
jgi:hypothetical protein